MEINILWIITLDSCLYLINIVFLHCFVCCFSGFVGGIDSLMKYFEGDKLVSSTLLKFSCTLTELQSYLTVSDN